MHEIGIAKDVLDAVFKELEFYHYEKVSKIVLTVGEYNLLTQESLQSAFDLAAENTKAQGAVLEVEPAPGMEIEIRHVEAE
jgi:Zn finger protein HypA/HybF involved in hydrogenase expression